MPKFSVIVPNYNHAPYLRRRLETIFAQTEKDLEVIVLDDASTDESLKVLEELSNEFSFSLVTNQHNTGSPSRQWGRGVELATGEYIWIAESDDYADPHLLAELSGALEAHPSAGLACCDCHYVDTEGRKIPFEWPKDLPEGARWRSNYFNSGKAECRDFLTRYNSIPNASGVLFRASSLRGVGLEEIDLRLCGDWLTYARVLMSSDIVYVAKALNYHRWHLGTLRNRVLFTAKVQKEKLFILDTLARELKLPSKLRRSIAYQMWGEMLLVCGPELSTFTGPERQDILQAHRKLTNRPSWWIRRCGGWNYRQALRTTSAEILAQLGAMRERALAP